MNRDDGRMELHQLVDMLGEEDVPAVRRVLEALTATRAMEVVEEPDVYESEATDEVLPLPLPIVQAVERIPHEELMRRLEKVANRNDDRLAAGDAAHARRAPHR